MTETLLIKSGAVLSMDPSIGDLRQGDVLIEGDRIRDVAPRIDCGEARILDASRHVVLPGLINAHIHTWQVPLRGIGGDWAGPDYDTVLHTTLAPRYTPEDLHSATLFGALAQLDAGTTTLFDWCHNNPTSAHSDAAIDALREAGIRAVFGHGTAKPQPRPGEPHFSTVPHPRAEIRRLRTGPLANDEALVTLAACILGPDYSTLEVCRQDFALAREYGLLSSAHAWGTTGRVVPDGYRPLIAEGLIGPEHNLVHGNYIEDDELEMLFEAGASVTSSATVELRAHVRMPLAWRVRRLGGKPSVGVDCTAFGCDRMLDALRFALQSFRLMSNQARLSSLERDGAVSGTRQPADAGGSIVKEVAIRSREILEWGTINNAKALRLDHRIGSLAPGKQADIIMVRRDSMNIGPTPDPAETLLHFAQNADVEVVLVAGRIVKQDGRLLHGRLDSCTRKVAAVSERLLASLSPELRRRCALG